MSSSVQVSVVSLPRLRKPTTESFDTDPKRVREWVASLPMANLGQAAKLVFEALVEVNRLETGVDERFLFLEAIRDPVRTLSEALEGRFVDQTYPLPRREQKVAALTRAFQEGLALGYKLVVQQLLDSQPSFRRLFQSSQMCTSLHRALRHMGQVLLHCYQVYAPYPENTWREVHHLYQVAADIRCVSRQIRDEHYSLIDESTAGDAYKQVLLLALAGPYRLRPGEVLTVYTALERLASHCALAPIGDHSDHPQGLFAIQVDSDQQPDYLQLRSGQNQGMAWVLDTTSLGSVLRSQLARLQHSEHPHVKPPADLPESMSGELLHQLMSSWGMMTERQFERAPRQARAEVALGVAGAHRALGGPPRRDTYQDDEDEEEDEKRARARPRLQETHDVTLEGNAGSHWATSTLTQRELATFSCRVLDQSAGGFRLEWRGDNRVRLKIGNLIAVRVTEDGSPTSSDWSLGLIRWMRAKSADILEFGVQSLAATAEPVLLRVSGAEGRCGDFVEAFLVPAVHTWKRSESLLVPGFLEHFFRPKVIVSRLGRETGYRLTRLIESTGVVALFEYVADQGSVPEPAEAGGPGLERVWDLL